MILLCAGDGFNLRIRKFQDDLFLIIHHVDPSPVDGYNELVCGKLGTRGSHGLVEPGEQEGPLEPRKVDHVLLYLDVGCVLLHIVALELISK